jgi:hypothetical protein
MYLILYKSDADSHQVDPLVYRNSPATQFVLFPKLPPEIRIYIWRLLVPKSRIVALGISDFAYSWIDEPRLKCDLPKPIIFDICPESRAEAHRIYTTSFATEQHKSPTWIDPINDVVHVQKAGFGVFETDLYSVQHLACDAVHGIPFLLPLIRSLSEGTPPTPWIRKFEQLRALTIVMHDGLCRRRNGAAHKEHERFVDFDSQSLRGKSNRKRLDKYLDYEFKNIIIEYPDWKEPRVRVVGNEVDGVRCCHL